MVEGQGLRLVDDFLKSSKSQRVFCNEKNIKRSTLRYWLKRSEEIADGKDVVFRQIVLDGVGKC